MKLAPSKCLSLCGAGGISVVEITGFAVDFDVVVVTGLVVDGMVVVTVVDGVVVVVLVVGVLAVVVGLLVVGSVGIVVGVVVEVVVGGVAVVTVPLSSFPLQQVIKFIASIITNVALVVKNIFIYDLGTHTNRYYS